MASNAHQELLIAAAKSGSVELWQSVTTKVGARVSILTKGVEE